MLDSTPTAINIDSIREETFASPSKDKLHFVNSDEYFDALNKDKSHFINSNDECTPMGCVKEMVSTIPASFWRNPFLKVLDPCAGNGNFFAHILKHTSLANLTFNEINPKRTANIKKFFGKHANVIEQDFLSFDPSIHQYDLVVANPPYAMFNDGKRVSKNHNLSRLFIAKGLEVLKPGGFMLYIVPDNWMSYSDRNLLPKTLSQYQFLHINCHGAKKWFPKVGSSFCWFLLQKSPNKDSFVIENHYKRKDSVRAKLRSGVDFIPLYYNDLVASIFEKTIYADVKKHQIQTSSDLHRYTKKDIIAEQYSDEYKFPLTHTPTQSVWAKRPHKFQDGWKVFLSLTNKYGAFVGKGGMTQSIAFIRCKTKQEAETICKELSDPLYLFLNNLTRYGNFNNVRVMQKFPKLNQVNLTQQEKTFIKEFSNVTKS